MVNSVAPAVSNPSPPAPSVGSRSPARRSSPPNRSRSVLLYSTRFSRRLRGGAASAWRNCSGVSVSGFTCDSVACRAHAANRRRSASVGCGLAGGGISLACIRSPTCSHNSPCLSASAGVSICSRSSPPLRFAVLWQLKQ